MKHLSTAEIREAYLRFFEDKGNKRMPSSSLIPDDPSMLLTSAGMVQFKPYFLQQKHLPEPYVGAATVQKCVRTNDIEIIGTTGRHLSFFEMLGNFSFGAYFKKEMCAWAYEFSTQDLGLDPDRLYYTVFEDDDETIGIWESLGIEPHRISRLGEKDNFWNAGPTGPCGPCSELYYDQGPEFGCGSENCGPGCDCDRYLEYWNLVFTQYDRQEDGSLVELPKKNIDTGMGLERIAAILQQVQSNYETDVLRSLIAVGERLSGKSYKAQAGSSAPGVDPATPAPAPGTAGTPGARGVDPAAPAPAPGAPAAVAPVPATSDDDLCLRIIADHARSVTFMIADGILPANEGRGYVLRRLLRRAIMKANMIGIEGAFLGNYVDEVVRLMGGVYPELTGNHELILRVVLSEEERFGATLRQGKAYLEAALRDFEGASLGGTQTFTLHDTYGFPIEVTEEIAAARGITVDREGFARLMEEQRTRARAHAKDADKAWSTYGGVMSDILREKGATDFLGYKRPSSEATVIALVCEGERVESLSVGQSGEVVCDQSPFYAEKGGQVGDTGTMCAPGLRLVVTDTQEPEKGLVSHTVTVEEGKLALGDTLQLAIDAPRRERISRNHTATHILHWALREVLGEHVKQAGSLVAPNRLRFDFTHFEALTADQIASVERLANEKIMENYKVRAYETSLAAAREAGVVALFGEKYGDYVRVLDIEGFSQELCGGTHVTATGEIGFVKVVSEASVGANLRRIEAVSSFDALAYLNRIEAELKEAASGLKVPLFEVAERAAANARALKERGAAQRQSKQVDAEESIAPLLEAMTDVGYPLVIAKVGLCDAGGLRNRWDMLRTRMASPGACVLAAEHEGAPLLLAAAAPEAVDAGFDAVAVIKAVSSHIQGGGGGKPTMAQAGGRRLEGIDAALQAARGLFV
ncbi:MAG: alanine--tRNA ligase [Coriobacteriaceae bacterium]|jgi:alanyl-tRNA synthetase|nr:alanine--tRNA ligase [Coriobacteriaceae bacterium]